MSLSDVPMRIEQAARAGVLVVVALAPLGCQVHAGGTANLNGANLNATASASASSEPAPAPAPAPVGAASPPAKRTVFAKVLIEFEKDKWDLDAGDQKNLGEFVDDVCDAHAKNPNETVVVEGHADGRGPSAHNVDLSKHRAEAIREWLVANNKLCTIDPSHIQVRAYGEGEPRNCHQPVNCIADDGSPLGAESSCKKCWEENRMTMFALEASSPASAAAPPPVASSAPAAQHPVVQSSCSRVLVLGEERGSRMCEQGKGS
jgi:outer membrane protein OmpA-like peptidoglycan-associated protein